MKMLRKVRNPIHFTPSETLRYATPAQKKHLKRLAQQLRGKRVVHVNATPVGGGPAEMFRTFIPELRALGVQAEWYVIAPNAGQVFFDFFDEIRNALQGLPVRFSPKGWAAYQRVNQAIAADLQKLTYDVLVLHDPQPLWSVMSLNDDRPKIYVNHLDTSKAHPRTWKKFLPAMKRFDAMVFSNSSFIHPGLPKHKTHVVAPAIDPLALKQRIVPRLRARRYLVRHGIPAQGPLVVQVSRFDVWKNPLGVVAAHHMVHQALPKTQLALIGLKEAKDNGDAARVYRDVVRVAQAHQSIHLFFDPWGITNIAEFTMMVQNAADIIVQNSTKEGFGLTVAEAMWKSKPVVGGPASGIRRQIRHGQNGYIVRDSEALAQTIIRLLQHPKLRKRIGAAGRASVTKNFLMSRMLFDHLKLYQQVLPRSD